MFDKLVSCISDGVDAESLATVNAIIKGRVVDDAQSKKAIWVIAAMGQKLRDFGDDLCRKAADATTKFMQPKG